MRYATEEDLPAIVAIYNAAVPSRRATADLEPVEVESKRTWFNSHSPERYPLLVHEIDGKVVAWISLQSFHGRPVYRYTAEISLYIAPEHQGKGLGRLLMEAILKEAERTGLKNLTAYIFSHNERSLNLFRSVGFEEWGFLPNVTEMDGKEYSVTILGKRIQP